MWEFICVIISDATIISFYFNFAVVRLFYTAQLLFSNGFVTCTIILAYIIVWYLKILFEINPEITIFFIKSTCGRGLNVYINAEIIYLRSITSYGSFSITFIKIMFYLWDYSRSSDMGHLRVLKHLPVIDSRPLLGGNIKKIFGTKLFLHYSRHVRYLGCPLLGRFTVFIRHLSIWYISKIYGQLSAIQCSRKKVFRS